MGFGTFAVGPLPPHPKPKTTDESRLWECLHVQVKSLPEKVDSTMWGIHVEVDRGGRLMVEKYIAARTVGVVVVSINDLSGCRSLKAPDTKNGWEHGPIR